MADDTTQRYRGNDPYGRDAPDPYGRGPGASARRGSGNDPLAELARLIGQNDPFAEFGRDGRRAPQEQHPARDDWPAGSQDGYANPASYPQHAPAGGYPGDEAYYGAQQSGGSNQEYADQHYDAGSYGGGAHDAGHDPHAYEPQAHAYPGQDGYVPAYQADAYHREYGHVAESGEETYDDAPRGRRSGLTAVLAVLGLAIVGTAGAFAYRTVYGNSGSTSTPPVIMASPAPNKVVPAAQSGGDSQANKLIYDRIGERSQDEKVVSREEQPVEVKPAAPARVVFPNSPNTAPMASAPATGANEPKRVKTVAIPANQPETRAPASQPPRSSSQNAAPAPASGSGSSVATRNPAPLPPPPQASAPSPAAAASQAPASSNAPLSLAPQSVRNEPAPAAAPSVRTAAASPPAARPATSSSDGTGSFHVQVSSQRSESDAQASFRALQTKFPNVLGSWQAIVRRADLGDKGVYYRAMVGPFSSLSEATDMCGELKSAGGQCIVQRN